MSQSSNNPIRTVGVIGAGTMGHGIAQVFVQHRYAVLLGDASATALSSAADKIARGLSHQVEKGRLTAEEKAQALARLRITSGLEDFAGADFIIEAVTENFDVKAGIFRALASLTPPLSPETMLASNTSSISITRLAAVTSRPERFVGMHFFNPVAVMKLVEVISGLETAPETVQAAIELAASIGKSPVRVNDSPGFISNRVLMPMINEAIYCLMEGVAEPRAIDGVMKLGMNHPMGPLELADFIGLDVCLDTMEVLHEGYHDSKYRPCPLLEKMVSAGRLGRKTGRGFYKYDNTRSASA